MRIFVDGHAGLLLPPPKQTLLQRWLEKPPPYNSFRVHFEHKNFPIEVKLLISSGKGRSKGVAGGSPPPLKRGGSQQTLKRQGTSGHLPKSLYARLNGGGDQ